MTSRLVSSLVCATGILAASSVARADQKLRVQVDQHGDFIMVGNTAGWDCSSIAPSPLPVVGTVPGFGACGLTTEDSSIDVFWESDYPAAGQATADLSIQAASARSTAYLNLPANSQVTHAFLYWGARHNGNGADPTAVFERPGVFNQAVTATSSSVLPIGVGDSVYQSVADVTSLVRANGTGAYRVSSIDVEPLSSTYQDVLYAGWALVVFYELDSAPTRNLAIFDGLDDVQPNSNSQVSLSGFTVPNAGFDAKLGVLVYEGDDSFDGDSLLFGKAPLGDNDRLSDALNPIDNFFNSTHSSLGSAVSQAGDLPQLTGQPRTMAGIDLDTLDVTSRVSAGQTSVDVQATTTLDEFFLGAFITSITTYKPDFITSTKTAKDINGGTLQPGDALEYTIVVANTGNDASTNTQLTDVLPTGTTLVPGSISITTGANVGAKTEAVDGDQASYDAASRTITVNVGDNATASTGGSIAIGGSSTVVFRVTVDANTTGVISNQGKIIATGQRGAPSSTTLTDSDPSTPGSNPTDTPTGGCTSDAQCSGSKPYCDTTQPGGVCVPCTKDAQCPGTGATCDLASHTCKCPGAAMSCLDTDGDGLSDPDEIMHGTNPNDADSDDDGVPDGKEKDPFVDSDGDGLINALDPDSDDDGLFDGTEQGYDCSNPATNVKLGHCRPDADMGKTTTDPTNADTDGGGARDGAEDSNLNGGLDAGERDPTIVHAADDKTVVDSDGDGLSDPEENTIHSDPHDTDSDDDGLPDGQERNPSDDTDGDGLPNVDDVDSDNDGLYDGTESGKDCSNKDIKPGHCIPDADMGATTTSPVKRDTDGGGAIDGSEDSNRNGADDPGERDPTVGHGADDTSVVDSDGDGLSDPLETNIGSDPHDADSDDDGVRDGDEANFADDTDGDGKKNIVDPDSDNDGLGDGTERGTTCMDPATDRSKNQCAPDADAGQTTTSMIDPDTDHGGVPDGVEDSNHNGRVDPGERDPNNPLDDFSNGNGGGLDGGVGDGGANSGGNRDGGGSGDLYGPDGGLLDNGYSAAGGGCSCDVARSETRMPWSTLLGVGTVALCVMRRRRRAS